MCTKVGCFEGIIFPTQFCCTGEKLGRVGGGWCGREVPGAGEDAPGNCRPRSAP